MDEIQDYSKKKYTDPMLDVGEIMLQNASFYIGDDCHILNILKNIHGGKTKKSRLLKDKNIDNK